MTMIRTLKSIVLAGTAVALMAVINVGCRDMEGDQEQIRKMNLERFPIDTIDTKHDWNLVKVMATTILADVDDNVARVQVLTANPYETDAEILAETFATKGEKVSMIFEMPLTSKDFYVAAVTRQGRYYVKKVTDAGTVQSFADGVVMSEGNFHTPIYQTFTFLFEEDFPLPGDFDFNDVVLRISRQVPSQNMLKLTVTLDAVGSNKKLAAAIRLGDVLYDQVAEVTIDEGLRFDEGLEGQRFFIDDKLLWKKGLTGEAVINLFDDAHWSLNPEQSDGIVSRPFLNTRKYEVNGESMTVEPQTRTYTIRFNEGVDASKILMSQIDPFIIEAYSSLSMEVHTYCYKFVESLWHYTSGNYNTDERMAWALMVPDAKFRYPAEGVTIGRYRNGEIFGAYSRYYHSFGEWGRNHEKAIDWWQYPTSAQVY